MSENTWMMGEICERESEINLEQSVLIAQVYSQALQVSDEGLVGVYVLVHDLKEEDASRAMEFFALQPSLIVDTSALVEDTGAEFPALVVIRYHDDPSDLLAQAAHFDFLKLLPSNDVVNRDGWKFFCAYDAIVNGGVVDKAASLPKYEARALRRMVYANRASVVEDRSPWFEKEYEIFRRVTEGSPEGSEVAVAMAEDMQAALENRVDIGATYSVIIPTSIERRDEQDTTLWINQAGREVVVAYGLDAIQAARALKVVEDDVDSYVDHSALRKGHDVRETVCAPVVIMDRDLNWIGVDFSGRREHGGYAKLGQLINSIGHAPQQPPQRAAMGR